MQGQFLTDRDLAERYRIHRATVWTWTREGRLPRPVRLTPRCSRWRLEDIEAAEQAMAEDGEAAEVGECSGQ